jgi:hypothetical protein
MRRPIFALTPAILLVSAVSFAIPAVSQNSDQNSDFNMNAHINSHVAAKDIGLPEYPGATPYKDKDSDSSSVDLGFLLNSFHLSVKAASFVTTDSPDHVLQFYRKPLSRYGEVLECNHGKPVGSLTVTKTGLTCGDNKSGHMTVNGSDSDRELRAGKPDQFWIVGIDSASVDGKTKFGLVALVLPKDSK